MKVFEGYDIGIVLPTLLLAISLIVLSSLDVALFQNQLLFSLLGIVLFFAISSIQVRTLHNFTIPFYSISLALLLVVLFFGIDVRGASRWVELFGVRFQFSEAIKPFLIIAAASLFSAWGGKMTFRRLSLSILLFFPLIFLLFRQPDLGTAIVFTATFFFLLVRAGVSVMQFLGGVLFAIVSAPLVWQMLADYQKNRILSFLNPGSDPLGIGYNAVQSAIAIGSGLLFGRGLGRGVQSQLQFLPERHTDFIFATFSEEFGFVGSTIVLLLYFVLLFRMLRISSLCEERFESYVVLGAFAIIFSQVFINIGMNLGLVPITGVTLPLLSYGGSSLVSTMMLLGIVNSIARGIKQKETTLEIH